MTTMDFFNSGMHNGFVVTDDLRSSMIINEGAEDKFFIEYEDKLFLVKDSSFNKRRKQQSLAPFCEYVGSNFILASGLLSCQKCYLGQYENRPVVICQNAFPGGEFRPFRDLHESSAGTDLSTKEYTYSDVLYVLEVKEKLEGIEREMNTCGLSGGCFFLMLYSEIVIDMRVIGVSIGLIRNLGFHQLLIMVLVCFQMWI